GLPYLVMEFVDGRPIDRDCDERRLSVDERLRLFATVCDAVHHLHQNLVVHRDIKPSNILVDADGRPRLLDFGIAKLLDDGLRVEGIDATMPGLRLMTPRFASPEQIKGEPVTTATDVHALGALLYRLLCGRDPFGTDGGPLHELERMVCEDDPRRPSTAVRRADTSSGRTTEAAGSGAATTGGPGPGDAAAADSPETIAAARRTTAPRLRRRLAGDLDTIVLKAMSKEPSDRYASARQLADDVRNVLHDRPVLASPTPVARRLAKFARRNPLGTALTLALAASVVAGTSGVVWWAGRTRAESLRADREAEAARVEAANGRELNRFLKEMLTSVRPGMLGPDARMRDVLDRAAERLAAEPVANPAVEAELLSTLGRSHLGLGELESAEEGVRAAARAARRAFGDGDPRLAPYLTHLAEVLSYTGGFDEADRLLVETRECLGPNPDPEALGLVLAQESSLAQTRGDLARAEALARRLVEIQRASTGIQGTLLPEGLGRLGGVLANGPPAGLAEAEALLRESLDRERDRYPDDHPNVSNKRIELAFVLWRRGAFDEALALARTGFRDMAARFGDDNVSLAPSLTLLGMLHSTRGELDLAEERLRRALALQRGALAGDHPSLAYTLVSLGQVQERRGDFREAAAAFDEALAIRTRVFGAEDRTVASAAEFLGLALRGAGDLDGAAAALERAVAAYRATLGERHPTTTQAMLQLGLVEAARGRDAEAGELYRRAATIERETLAIDDPRRPNALYRHASAVLASGRAAEAAPLLRELAGLLESRDPPPLERVSLVRAKLGACLLALGEVDEAESLLLDAHARAADGLDRDATATRRLAEVIAELYRKTDRPEEAARFESR
ncbi:MAG: tetratricopeptide repeat protein, partial [Planctomycetota bacterium JB042]